VAHAPRGPALPHVRATGPPGQTVESRWLVHDRLEPPRTPDPTGAPFAFSPRRLALGGSSARTAPPALFRIIPASGLNFGGNPTFAPTGSPPKGSRGAAPKRPFCSAEFSDNARAASFAWRCLKKAEIGPGEPVIHYPSLFAARTLDHRSKQQGQFRRVLADLECIPVFPPGGAARLFAQGARASSQAPGKRALLSSGPAGPTRRAHPQNSFPIGRNSPSPANSTR